MFHSEICYYHSNFKGKEIEFQNLKKCLQVIVKWHKQTNWKNSIVRTNQVVLVSKKLASESNKYSLFFSHQLFTCPVTGATRNSYNHVNKGSISLKNKKNYMSNKPCINSVISLLAYIKYRLLSISKYQFNQLRRNIAINRRPLLSALCGKMEYNPKLDTN